MNPSETKEEVVAEEVITEETPTEVIETEGEESTTDDKKESLTIDYKAEHDKLQKLIAADAFKFRKQKKSNEGMEDEERDDSESDKPLTMAEVQKLLDERESKLSRQFSVKEATQIATSLTTNEDEAQYAVALWEHVSLPFDTMQEQMEFIVSGLNAKRILAQNNELKRALQGKNSVNKNTATTVRDPLSSGQPKINPQIAAALKNTGYTYNSTQKVYSKKLAGGKTLYNDGKGKTWVA